MQVSCVVGRPKGKYGKYSNAKNVTREILEKLAESPKTYYQLGVNEETQVASRATVLKILKEMAGDGLIAEEKAGPRNTKPYRITNRGQIKLLLWSGLSEEKQVEIFKRLDPQTLTKIKAAGVNLDRLILSMLKELKPRFNADYWDETYFNRQLSHAFNDLLRNTISNTDYWASMDVKTRIEKAKDLLPNARKTLQAEIKNDEFNLEQKRRLLQTIMNEESRLLNHPERIS